MPYTKSELTNVDFYNEFIENLRSEYFSKLVKRAKTRFRDNDNVLYSFEDIDSTLGIEDAELQQNPTYDMLKTELNRQNLRNINRPPGYEYPFIAFEELFQYESCSLQNRTLNVINKEEVGSKTINRTISELISIEILDPLPDELQNGDFLAVNNPNDNRKWLIEGNQKRIFPDLATFFGSGFDFNKLKEKELSVISQIPDGEPV
jgi:hypothetical protein